jgi:transposase InsO family protein
MGISRACASKWVNRWHRHGELGLHDRPSTPHHSPDATLAWVIVRIETWRREKKWSASRITHELAELDFRINRRTVTRHLTRLGLGQRRFIDPSGHSNRKPGKIIARWPGHMAHLDVKKVGRIPDGGGWRIHGRNSAQKRAVDRAKTAGAKAGYLYLHSIVDGFSRLAYTEPLDDEKGTTAAAFLARAKVWFAAHGITHIHRIVTDNGACYRSNDFARIVGQRTRHQKTKPYTPRHNGKAERYQRIMTEELLYAREYASEDERSQAIAIWNVHYNYHRPHSAAGGQPPASRLKTHVTNVRPHTYSPRYAWPLLAASARACAAAIASAAAAADHGLAERARHLLDRLRARLEPEPVRGYRRGMLDHRGEVKQDAGGLGRRVQHCLQQVPQAAADVSNRLTGREVVKRR